MHILIAGGGIAGSVTGLALQRAGIGATIFEAHPPTDQDVGSYFAIAPNGLDALAAVEARQLATSDGLPTRRNELWDANGGRLGSTGLGAALPDGTVAQTVKRATLSRRLLEEAERRGVPVGDRTSPRRGRARHGRSGRGPVRRRIRGGRATCSSAPTASTRSPVGSSIRARRRVAMSG